MREPRWYVPGLRTRRFAAQALRAALVGISDRGSRQCTGGFHGLHLAANCIHMCCSARAKRKRRALSKCLSYRQRRPAAARARRLACVIPPSAEPRARKRYPPLPAARRRCVSCCSPTPATRDTMDAVREKCLYMTIYQYACAIARSTGAGRS
jgi:hypothetical protein